MFFIVGAQKSGTTTIHEWLKREGCRMPISKETHYFSDDERYQLGEEWYEEQFCGAGKKGEVDPEYLYSDHAAERIKKRYPSAKIIIILRNPLDRAHSQYKMSFRRGIEHMSFEDALKYEEQRIGEKNYKSHLSYMDRSIYSDQIKRYLEVFDKKDIKFFLYEDFFSDDLCDAQFLDLCEFIGITKKNKINIGEAKNKSTEAIFRSLNALIWNKQKYKTLRSILKIFIPTKTIRDKIGKFVDKKNRKINFSNETKIEFLIGDKIKKDILTVRDLTGLDTSIWIKNYK